MIETIPHGCWVPGIRATFEWSPAPGVFCYARSDSTQVVLGGDHFGFAPLCYVAVPGRVAFSPNFLNVMRSLVRARISARQHTGRKAGRVLTINANAVLSESRDGQDVPLPYPLQTPLDLLVEALMAGIAAQCRDIPERAAFLTDNRFDRLLPLLVAAREGKRPVAVLRGTKEQHEGVMALCREHGIETLVIPFLAEHEIHDALAHAAIYSGMHDRFALDELAEASVAVSVLKQEGFEQVIDPAYVDVLLGTTFWLSACAKKARGIYWERALWYRAKYIVAIKNARLVGARVMLAQAEQMVLRPLYVAPPLLWFLLRCPPAAAGGHQGYSELAKRACEQLAGTKAVRYLLLYDKKPPRVGEPIRKIGTNVLIAIGERAVLDWRHRRWLEDRD